MPPEAGDPANEPGECSSCLCASHPSFLFLPNYYASAVGQGQRAVHDDNCALADCERGLTSCFTVQCTVPHDKAKIFPAYEHPFTMEPVPASSQASPSGIELVQMGKRTEARGAEDNWTGLSSAAERRKLQNRLSQRRYSEYLPLPLPILFYLCIFTVLCKKANCTLAVFKELKSACRTSTSRSNSGLQPPAKASGDH